MHGVHYRNGHTTTTNTLALDAFEELELCFLFFLPFVFVGFFVVLAAFSCFDIEADSVYFWKDAFSLDLEIIRASVLQSSNVSKVRTIGGVSPNLFWIVKLAPSETK